jgi:O-antigen ligase
MVYAFTILILKGRAVYLFLPTAIAVSVAIVGRANIGKRFILALCIGTITGIIVLTMAKLGFLGEVIQERFMSIFGEGMRTGGRVFLWKSHIETFLASPVLGKGLRMMTWDSPRMQVAHNDWLTLAANLGLPAIIAFFGFHTTLFIRIRQVTDTFMQLFCTMVWVFVMLGGMTQTDYRTKYYTLALSFVILVVRYDESYRAGGISEPYSLTEYTEPQHGQDDFVEP